MNSSTSVIVSAREWAASLIIAEEWLIRPPTSLAIAIARLAAPARITVPVDSPSEDRKSTRLNSSHPSISYAVFCLKKKKTKNIEYTVPTRCRIHVKTGQVDLHH